MILSGTSGGLRAELLSADDLQKLVTWQEMGRGAKLGSMYHCETYNIWMFPKIGVPQNGWFIMEKPIKMDDLGVPLFSETPIYTYIPLLIDIIHTLPRVSDG